MVLTIAFISNTSFIKSIWAPLNIAKPFTEVGAPASAQINETFKRDVEFGKKYKVIFTSNSVGGSGNMPIDYRNLNAANNPIRVTGGGKRIELKDGFKVYNYYMNFNIIKSLYYLICLIGLNHLFECVDLYIQKVVCFFLLK